MNHIWGDDWPHWEELSKAERWMNKFYNKVTGNHLLTKEKYGTIRYDLENTNELEAYAFKETIRRAVKKFKNVAGEISDDAGLVLDDEYFMGWCAGVTFAATGQYWISDERPKGV